MVGMCQFPVVARALTRSPARAQALSNLINEHAALTADMALRIAKAFGPRMEHLMQGLDFG